MIRANGKLLLTGEYFVLDGLPAIALPTQYGQSIDILPIKEDSPPFIHWCSLNYENKVWLDEKFDTIDFLPQNSENPLSVTLSTIFKAARQLNPYFLKDAIYSLKCTTRLDFPNNWGLGTSSTLIALIADWAEVNPYQLLSMSFGGSGYDIACAFADSPISYTRNGFEPMIAPVSFRPPFLENLYFVWQGKKQNSREAIAHYKNISSNTKKYFAEVLKHLTDAILENQDFYTFEKLMNVHEALMSEVLNLPTIKSISFDDYWGSVKSLGAWGGDFVLVSSDRSPQDTFDYFAEKGFLTCLPYHKMILDQTL